MTTRSSVIRHHSLSTTRRGSSSLLSSVFLSTVTVSLIFSYNFSLVHSFTDPSAASLSDATNFNSQSVENINRLKRSANGKSDALFQELGIPKFWEDYENGDPWGIVLRGWRFARCPSELWNDYSLNVTGIKIWPDYPVFPGRIYFNISFEVLRSLKTDEINLEVVLSHLTEQETGEKKFDEIPCHGWDINTGCGGGGSCRYCDVMDSCRKTVNKAKKYAKDNKKLEDILKKPQKLCPPPKGKWSISYDKVYELKDVNKGVFGPLQSNQYWFDVQIADTNGEKLGCFKLWADICKYKLLDPQKRCQRDPKALEKFIKNVTDEAKAILQPEKHSAKKAKEAPLAAAAKRSQSKAASSSLTSSTLGLLNPIEAAKAERRKARGRNRRLGRRRGRLSAAARRARLLASQRKIGG